jgi:MFS family permease
MSSRTLPGSVVILGLVSLFMDASSEMIHALLPVFLVTTLGVSALTVGFIEGIAEATASFAKIFSGAISDWVGRRKPLVFAGYGLAAVTKPFFALAASAGTVLAARFVDRVGKGLRGAPRDALIADLVPPEARGTAYGLRQSMDTVGAIAGPGLALLIMAVSGDNIRLVFWLSVVPAIIAVALIAFVHEPPPATPVQRRRFPIRRGELQRLGGFYWAVVAFATALTLARFSEAFLLLRAQDIGLAIGYVPIVMVVMNIVYAASAYPIGRLSDRIGRGGLLVLGIGILVVAHLVLAVSTTIMAALAGAALWGLHMGATQGLLSAVVADAAPADLRGTAFGAFNLLTGVGLLLASMIAGGLWSTIGPAATFLAGAAFAAVALVGLVLARARRGVDRAPMPRKPRPGP